LTRIGIVIDRGSDLKAKLIVALKDAVYVFVDFGLEKINNDDDYSDLD
jgi:ribose 5-phosphate isomerase RpiB